MKLANEDVSMLAFTSEQITVPFLLPEMVNFFHFFPHLCMLLQFQMLTPLFLTSFMFLFVITVSDRQSTHAPFLSPQVERVASMLNYFLFQLVGPQRKSLTLKDPEKYEFRPKQLLKQVGV